MKKYETPELFVDEFAPDTMIASGDAGNPKNGNADNNQNCWACHSDGKLNADGDACAYWPGDGAFEASGCK